MIISLQNEKWLSPVNPVFNEEAMPDEVARRSLRYLPEISVSQFASSVIKVERMR